MTVLLAVGVIGVVVVLAIGDALWPRSGVAAALVGSATESRLRLQLPLRAKLKQIFGFYQIATRVASVYEVPMPTRWRSCSAHSS